MNIHKLKTWPPFFASSLYNHKSFEYRLDDRGFRVGDLVILEEWHPATARYTGRTLTRSIVYIFGDVFGLPDKMVILGLIVV